jgi:hypothetical protein
MQVLPEISDLPTEPLDIQREFPRRPLPNIRNAAV